MIDLNRLQKLITNKVQPENKAEELLLLSYMYGIQDQLYLNLILQISGDYDNMTRNEVDHVVIGYALGQKTLRDLEESFETNNDPTFH